MTTKLGVNFFGSHQTSDGIGRAAALNLECLRHAGIEVDEYVLSRPVARQSGNDTLIDEELIKNLRHKINIFQFSARWVPHYFSQVPQGALDGFYNIGYWFCEVQKIPSQWASQLRYFDEVWTASAFCQNAIIRTAHIPVMNIPLLIENQVLTNNISQKLADNCNVSRIRYLSIFNTYSDAERKNILFSIRAFLTAFKPSDKVEYVIKVSNLEYDSRLKKILDNVAQTYSSIKVIDGYVPDEVITNLYESADVYISLHRAEGFGLTISDAMAKGIPVITTDYSGNMEFCRHKDTNLVESDLVNVGHERLRYKANDVWAEPKLESAVIIMQDIYNNYEEHLRKAQRARARLKNEFSIEVISSLMHERIQLIDSDFSHIDDLKNRELDCQVEIYDDYGFESN
ncbi:glycosyltransferase [Vibrio mediterranei]|uniref:Glycosyltransferase family 1 protein n=1 Tax=Vibrio mediterranei TaxID=689 RepID=A0A3G4V964_9VIBR|nr:glycosyltransferase [Vibrio mediterranei]AYV21224.1 glycosyltransferase family 1 protein [Vibrio mediterranei]